MKCEIFFENHMPTPLEKGHKSLGWMNSELKANLEIAELDAARGALHMQQFYAESYSHREDLTFVWIREKKTNLGDQATANWWNPFLIP